VIPVIRTDGELVLRLFDDALLPQIGDVLDVLVAAVGQPWRLALAQLERLDSVPARRRTRILAAVRRFTPRVPRARLGARTARALALGHPALTSDERTARLVAAAKRLKLRTEDLEALLWADLANERLVALPGGRPSARAIAAIANQDLLQDALRRSHAVSLRVWGDARPLLRVATGRGLQATAHPDAGESTRLAIRGPLSLFHKTTVYGRSLGGIVPLLAELPRFELTIWFDQFGEQELCIASPVLL
jgi:predicted nuclease of restriction endonuclease-like RecB superfamily